MQIKSESEVRLNLHNEMADFQKQTLILNDRISRLQHLVGRITDHLSDFETNQAKFNTLYNPCSEWSGTHRDTFDRQMDSDVLLGYRHYLTAVRGLKSDIQDEIRSLNSRLELTQTDISSLRGALNALKGK